MDAPWVRHYPPGARPQFEVPNRTIHSLFYDAARQHPDRTALIFYGNRISYARLAGWCDRFAAALARQGLGKGDRVGLSLPNCPQQVMAIIGCQRAGVIPVLFNPLYVTREIAYQARDAGIRLFITLDLLAARAVPALENVPLVLTRLNEYMGLPMRWLYPLKFKARWPQAPFIRWADFLSGPLSPPVDAQIDPARDLAVLFYTGGTTGVAKGVMISHRNLVANVMQTREMLEAGRRAVGLPENQVDVILAVLPIFHSFGYLNVASFGLSYGNTSILLPRFDPDDTLAAMARYKPTGFPGVPTIYTALLQSPKLKAAGVKSLQFCASGAAPLPVDLMKRFEETTGGTILEGYGLSETSPVTHMNPWNRRKPGSVGVPVPMTDCRIVDLETGADLPPDREGEVLLRGPQVMLGYWNKPEETAAALKDGWLYTGDIGRMDADGYLYIVDRKKDMIISGGFNIYPREIDEVLFQHPQVAEACAVGVSDEYRGETVKAFVVLKPGAAATADEIIAFCKERLAAYKYPRQVEFLPELPKSAVGKILRRELARLERDRQRTGTPV